MGASEEEKLKLRDGEELAIEHWDWMKKFISQWASVWANLIEDNYKEGFIHGFKHGQRKTDESLEKIMCDLHNKVVDLEKKVR